MHIRRMRLDQAHLRHQGVIRTLNEREAGSDRQVLPGLHLSDLVPKLLPGKKGQ
jgi:hypothetical protein